MMHPIWNPNAPSLLPTVVCYADILGFRAMIDRAHEIGKETEFLQSIKGTLASAYERLRDTATLGGAVPPIFEMKVFTDNIFVASPIRDPAIEMGEPELHILLTAFAEVQATLAADGLFLRGAIAAGPHYQDHDIAYGAALLEAVDLDKSGEPPRLVIGQSVERLISRHLSWYSDGWSPHHAILLEDPRDGRLFIDYLGVAFEYFPDGPINIQLLKAHKEILCERLGEFEPDTSVYAKYAWVAVYHNYACRRFADRFEDPGGEEDDPERIANADKARRSLYYLVPDEALPSDQPPRPLDVNRLRQRLKSVTRRD